MNNREDDARRKYSDPAVYSVDHITTPLIGGGEGFSAELLKIKASTLLVHCAGKRVLDIGCADGRHLRDISAKIVSGIGVDFSVPFIKAAVERNDAGDKLHFLVGDARALPLKSHSVDCVFSFASLYYVDDIEPVYKEINRVLIPGGVAILEVGNSRSLATKVSKRYPHLARHSRKLISEHLGSLKEAGLNLLEWRAFQLLPMWGDVPFWLRIFRLRIVEKIAAMRFRDKMIDERISSLWGLRSLAFRHILVCSRDD